MYVADNEVFPGGPASAAECLFRRLTRARRAREKAMEGDFELSNEYMEWLNYIWAAGVTGIERPWSLPEPETAAFLRWLVTINEGPPRPGGPGGEAIAPQVQIHKR